MIGYIYKIVNDINDKVYIGQTIQKLNVRFNCHCSKDNGKGGNMYIKRAILKYGKEHFQIQLIEEVDSTQLDEREIYWIKYYDSKNNGYNLTEGGNSNRENMNHPIEERINIEEFKKFIIENYPSVKQVEEHFNICHGTVYSLIRRLDCNLQLNPYNPKKPNEIDTEILLEKYNDFWSVRDLAKYFHTDKKRVSKALKDLGITPRRGVKGYKHRI